jgi:hypothetical protein
MRPIKTGKTTALKPYFDHLEEKLGYEIRLAFGNHRKENRPT